jgi:pimeloyl-ACP methyl ester carboxylesterase
MPLFKFDNIDFNYEDDKKEGMPFIFLHGLGGDVNQTLDILNEIPNVRRISIDFRGHGKTVDFGDVSKLNFKQFADDVKALIDSLEIEQFIIGGISTGAGVALNFALRYPQGIEKLIISRPAWENEPQPEDIQSAFRTIYQILNDENITDKKEQYKATSVYKKMNSLSDYVGNTLVGQFDYPYAKETSKKLIYIPSDCPNTDRREWKKLYCPTLILAAQTDPLHPFEFAETLYNGLPSAELKEITSKSISSKEHKKDSVNEIRLFIDRQSDN